MTEVPICIEHVSNTIINVPSNILEDNNNDSRAFQVAETADDIYEPDNSVKRIILIAIMIFIVYSHVILAFLVFITTMLNTKRMTDCGIQTYVTYICISFIHVMSFFSTYDYVYHSNIYGKKSGPVECVKVLWVILFVWLLYINFSVGECSGPTLISCIYFYIMIVELIFSSMLVMCLNIFLCLMKNGVVIRLNTNIGRVSPVETTHTVNVTTTV